MRNPLIRLGMWTVGLGSIAAFACSAPDPGVGYLGSPPTQNIYGGSSSGSSSGTPAPSGSSEDSGSTVVTPTGGDDAGGSGGADAGDDEGGAGFLGETTPWATDLPPQTAQASMAANGTVPAPTLDCMTSTCHGTGGAGGAFLAAGFVATAAGGTTGAADVEVRIYANGGTPAGYSAHTDSNGYFWISPPAGATVLGPFNGGVRAGPAGTLPILMQTTQGTATSTSLDCQSSTCHGGTAQGNIHI